MTARARIYLRISDDREGREIGVGRQDLSCRELAERLSAEVVEVYTENDVSASTLSKAERPEYDRLLIDAAADPGSMIIAYSNSRITRRPAEWEDLIRLYEDARVVIHTVASGSVDLSRADGRGVARTIAAWDAAEAERTSERVKDDVGRRANAGLPHGGSRAFGWTSDHKLDSAEHAILRELAERVLSGESLKSLVKDLTARGVKTVHGAPWSYQVIRQMLTNPRIAGWRTHKGEIVGPATWPAALSEETWQQLLALFSDPARSSGGSSGRIYLGTGLYRCGECDRRVGIRCSVSKARGTRRRYWCQHCGLYREVTGVDAYVTGAIVRMLEEYHENPEVVDPEVLKNVEGIRSRIQTVKREFVDDDAVSPQELREMLRHLRGRLQAEEAKLVQSRRHHIVGTASGPEASAAWEALGLDRKRAILDALVEVRIHRAAPGRKPFDPETVQILPR